MEETTLTAALPNLDIRILHREDPERGAETITMQITATPSFDAVAGLLAPSLFAPSLPPGSAAGFWLAPMQFWTGLMQQTARQMWAPWLRLLPQRPKAGAKE